MPIEKPWLNRLHSFNLLEGWVLAVLPPVYTSLADLFPDPEAPSPDATLIITAKITKIDTNATQAITSGRSPYCSHNQELTLGWVRF